MVSRKRTRGEMEASAPESPKEAKEPGLLDQLRNMWEFANLMQYIFTFGKVVKIDENFDIEDLEDECLKPGYPDKLMDLGLSLLKFVSSHRGLTSENFDEYTRRQYNAKAPHLTNPFGQEEEPKKFADFDVFQRIRVLHQLTLFTFWNPDRIREKMPEQKETDQTQWRIEELGYDRDDRYYYVLDDNRLYRRTDPPIPSTRPAKPKANSKKGRALARAAKRRKVEEANSAEDSEDGTNTEEQGNGYPLKWECIAITLSQYREFLRTIEKTKDPNEKILRDRIVEDILPLIEKLEEAQQRKVARREKELVNLQRMATAKRSSRLATKHEKERQEQEAAEAVRKRDVDLRAAAKEQEKQKKMEQDRQGRLMTRERRFRERESKRLQHEEELRRIEEEQKKLENGEGRVSERHLKAEMERRQKSLEALAQEDQWIFDCAGCGVHGENLDDGSHSIACEKCNVWQHSKCHGIPQQEAESEDFHFICRDCRQRIEDAKKPKLPPLKFRLGSSPAGANGELQTGQEQTSPVPQKTRDVTIAASSQTAPSPSAYPSASQGTVLFPQGHPGQLASGGPNAPSPSKRASPQVRPQVLANGSFSSPVGLAHPAYPPQSANGPVHSPIKTDSRPQTAQSPTQTPRGSHYPPTPGQYSLTQRPSSSHSFHGQAMPSPIQNTPSMSPTQGNRDVGPLAGFPPSTLPNGSVPGTPYGQHQAIRPNSFTHHPPSSQSRQPSFSSTAQETFAHTPPPPSSQHGMALSGLSPTKNSPARPMTAGSVTGASVMPPVQRLQPSPKLMGRLSPDAPIPPPVKSMTPEQEERRQRENEMARLNNGLQGSMTLPPPNFSQLHQAPSSPVMPSPHKQSPLPNVSVNTVPAESGQEHSN